MSKPINYIVIGRLCDYENHVVRVVAKDNDEAESKAVERLKDHYSDIMDDDDDIYIDFIIDEQLNAVNRDGCYLN